VSTNPFKQLREAADAALATVAGMTVKGIWNGEDWQTLNSIASRDGVSAWSRVAAADPNTDSPESEDCARITLQVIVAGKALGEGNTAAANAEQAAWDVYAALKQSDLSLAWLHDVLHFAGMACEYQDTSTAIYTVAFDCHAALAEWTDEEEA
jgi:hypothetical protein